MFLKRFLFYPFQKFLKNFNEKNPYFSVQFLFSWLTFKVLGFLNYSLLFKIGASLMVLLFLLLFWESILPSIFRSAFLQAYLYFFYFLINFFFPFGGFTRLFGFFLGFFLSFFLGEPLFIENQLFSFCIPNFDYLLIILVMFTFFKRFNDNIIVFQISEGLAFEFKSSHFFSWSDVIGLIHIFFKYKFPLVNCLTFLPNLRLNHFPVSNDVMDSLRELGINNTNKILKERFKMLDDNPNLPKEEFFGGTAELLYADLLKKKKILEPAAIEASSLNSTFFWHTVQGLTLGVTASTFLLNFLF